MKRINRCLPYLLPLRCIIFLLVFIVGAFCVDKKIDETSNWWSIVASAVNVITIYVSLIVNRGIESFGI